MTDVLAIAQRIQSESQSLQAVRSALQSVIVGQDALLDGLLIALLADGHVLLEGLPGLAKSLAVQSLARAVGGQFRRIQFTPDLLPADLVGTHVYNPKTGDWQVKEGPVFANFVLADEINRAPAKVQSALLEAMQERQVTLAGDTRRLPNPFLVLATQNPVEQEGTYALPEAQIDRFMVKLVVGYPSKQEELRIIDRMAGLAASTTVTQATTPQDLLRMRALLDTIYLDDKVKGYIVDLVFATRDPDQVGLPKLKPLILYGASPRASLALARASRARVPRRPRLRHAAGRQGGRHHGAAPPRADHLRGRGRGHHQRAGVETGLRHRAGAVVPPPSWQRGTSMARALDPELLAEARRIQVRADRLVTNVMAGGYSSVFRGSGIEFEEVREFAEGDELRSVDWNVTARTGRPFVKKFVEERELTVLFVLDMSASMAFGTRPVGSNRRTVAGTAALFVGCVAFAAARNNDKAGLITFSDRIERYVPAKKGRNHVLRLIREACEPPPPDRGTDLTMALDYAGRVQRRRAIVFVVSDFTGDSFVPKLRLLAQRHDVIAVRVRDPFAAGLDRGSGDVGALPNLGLLHLFDPESRRTIEVDTGSKRVRERIRANWRSERQQLLHACRRAGVDLLDVPTEGSVAEPLVRFFRMRELRGAKR